MYIQISLPYISLCLGLKLHIFSLDPASVTHVSHELVHSAQTSQLLKRRKASYSAQLFCAAPLITNPQLARKKSVNYRL